MHNKMSNQPEIASEMEKYIQEQVDIKNYDEIDLAEERKKHQLHFEGFNFVVSNTSTSTKVRMTTDSPCAPNPDSASTESLNLPLETFPTSEAS